MNIKIKVYNDSKYIPTSEKVAEVEYKNIKGLEIKTISDEEIFNMGFDDVDPCQEYCIITMEDDQISTFRNSMVDIFRI